MLLIKMDVTKRPMYKYYLKLAGYLFIYVSYKLSIDWGPVIPVGLPAVLGGPCDTCGADSGLCRTT